MTTDEAKRRVEEIRAIRGDDESAHAAEDQLYRDILKAIAEGKAENPAALCAEGLRTRRIRFCRWCA